MFICVFTYELLVNPVFRGKWTQYLKFTIKWLRKKKKNCVCMEEGGGLKQMGQNVNNW